VARPGPIKRLTAALEALEALGKTGEPLEAVAIARRIRVAAEEFERARVDKAREKGVSWREIGSLYDMSKQAAQQRFGGGVRSPGARPVVHGPTERHGKRRVGKTAREDPSSWSGSGAPGHRASRRS